MRAAYGERLTIVDFGFLNEENVTSRTGRSAD
jgi:hypothetical protein